MASAAGPSVDDSLMEETKSIIKSIIISAEGNASIGKVAREYEEMEGQAVPFLKLGFSSLSEFLRSRVFANEFFFGHNKDGFEVLKPKKDEKTAHIQDLVLNQRHQRKKRKPIRPGVSRSGFRSTTASSFNFHAAGLGRNNIRAFGGRTTTRPVVHVTPGQFHYNSAAPRQPARILPAGTGFGIKNQNQTPAAQRPPASGQQQQQPVRPLAANQQANSNQQKWSSSPVKPALSASHKTSTPITATEVKFNWDTGAKAGPTASPSSGRTVSANFAANRASAAAKPVVAAADAKPQVKVVTSPAKSFKAPINRVAGRGSASKQVKAENGNDAPGFTIDQLDQQHWLRLKCLQTLYYVKKEASTTGISISEFAAKFFNVNKTFLAKECDSVKQNDIISFLEKSFSSSSSNSSSPSSSPNGNMDCSSSEENSSSVSSNKKNLLNIVAKTTLMFNRARFCHLIQKMVNIVVIASIKEGNMEVPEEDISIPREFIPSILMDKLMQSLSSSSAPKYATKSGVLNLFIHWFFNRFLPSSTDKTRVVVPRDIRSFTRELTTFAEMRSVLTFDYTIFPVPADVEDFIRELDPDEITDPECIRTGDTGRIKWLPVKICSAISPSLIYYTRCSEQESMNLLSDEMMTYYESSEGKDPDHHIPMELLTVGSLIAVPLRSRVTMKTRRVFHKVDQNIPPAAAGASGDQALERQWTRAIITSPYNPEDKTFTAQMVDMGCALKFREGRFLPRSRFLAKEYGFHQGFAVQAGLFGLVPPISEYLSQFLADPKSLMTGDVKPADVPNMLSRKSFPVASVDFIKDNFASRKYLTACFFKSQRRGLRYESLTADVSTPDEDEFLTETLATKGLAEQLAIDEAIALLNGDKTMDAVLKTMLMEKLKNREQ